MMPFVETASGSFWYADHRDPTAHLPVTVLVHGAGGTHLDWPAEIRRLPEANAVALDLSGHGRSPGKGRSSVGAYAADVIAFMDALGLSRAIIAGHSMGAAIAMTMALTYPERIQGLILIGASAKLGVRPEILEGFTGDMEKTVALLVSLYYGRTGTDTMRRRSVQRLMEFDPAILNQDYNACNHFDIRNQVSFIRQPVLIIGGTDDQLTPFKYSEWLRDHINGAQLVKVDGAGHMMMIEQPETVAEAVRKWLVEQKW